MWEAPPRERLRTPPSPRLRCDFAPLRAWRQLPRPSVWWWARGAAVVVEVVSYAAAVAVMNAAVGQRHLPVRLPSFRRLSALPSAAAAAPPPLHHRRHHPGWEEEEEVAAAEGASWRADERRLRQNRRGEPVEDLGAGLMDVEGEGKLG